MTVKYHCEAPKLDAKSIGNEAALAKIARDARPGDYWKVQGSYDNDVVWRANGTEPNPIFLDFGQAKMKDMVFKIEGDWIRVIGGDWRNSQVTVEGDNNRVSRCRFHDGKTGGNSAAFNSAVLVTRKASYNRVDHCLVERWVGRGIRQAKAVSGAKHNLFDHNHLRNMSDGSNKNGREAMQIGSGATEQRAEPFHTVMTRNLIEDYDLESEAISVKANGNTVTYNTIEDCKISYVVCRSGSDNLFGGNSFRNSRGLIIYGDRNKVIDNAVMGSNSRSEIGIRSGDCTAEQLKQGEYPGGHPAARWTIAVGNDCRIGEEHQIGEWGTGKVEYYDEQWIPATDTVRFENRGELRTDGRNFRAGSIEELESYNGVRYTPKRLTAAEVGPSAPDPFCTQDPDDSLKALKAAYIKAATSLAAHEQDYKALGRVIESMEE